MVYPIYVYGSAVLSKVAQPITKDYPNLEQLIKDMFETMYATDGVGLAGPQVGKSIRLFTVDTTPFIEKGDKEKPIVKTFINAQIIERSEEKGYFNEGCLSVPGFSEDVSRPTSITIRYQDDEFVEHEETYSGYAARVIQHEYDHLEGMLFVDRVSPLRKQLIKSKLAKIARGDFRSRFACKLVK